MRFRLTGHAEEELARRMIPRELLDSVLENPQQVVPNYGGRKAYQSKLDFGGGKIYLLRAIVDDLVNPATVVTVSRTSQIDRCWRNP